MIAPRAKREGEGQLRGDRQRLEPGRDQILDQPVFDVTRWPAADHVGGKGAGVIRLSQGVAMRIVHVGFRAAHERSADTSFQSSGENLL